MSEKRKILIVDDHEKNIKLLAVICRDQGHEIIEAHNGREALDAVGAQPPDVIFMDVMMPEMDGMEATEILKGNPNTAHIPIIMVTALDSREDRLRGIQAGADDFLTKPVDTEELILRLKNNLRSKDYHDFLENHADILEQQLKERTIQLRHGYIDTIQRLVLASEYKDEDTGSHIRRISHYTKELAGGLGMPGEFTDTIYYVSPMHDIGKVAIPDRILLKEGPLDAAEWETMKTHTSIGARILEGSDSPFLTMAVAIAQSHHERWDGKGYPHGLSGESIPLLARILAVVDSFDAMAQDRPYRKRLTREAIVEEIRYNAGRQFDPKIAGIFLDEIIETVP